MRKRGEGRVPIRKRLRDGRKLDFADTGENRLGLYWNDWERVRGLTALGAPHFCAEEAEAYLMGKEPTEEHIAEAGRLAAQACNPRADQRGPVEYKLHLANELTQRVLRTSVERAEGRH